MRDRLKTALVQADLVWEAPAQNRIRFESQIRKVLSNEQADLVILPEMFSTGFTMDAAAVAEGMDDDTVNWMMRLARELDIAICGSLVINEDNRFYNRFMFVYPEGNYLFYDKRHCFTLAGEDKSYTPGTERVVVSYKGWRIFPQICYDLRFPVWSRNNLDYDLAIYVANWPEMRIGAWSALLKARAIENMSYVIGVNRVGKDGNGYPYTGASSAYDPLGYQLCYSETEEILIAELSRSAMIEIRDKLGFLKDQDTFTLG
ncbi:amidohydrolase [Robertkochia solimangrovi]|uniref:amidohydrolase n=1 Tax=Robertkochia solimangrovi TaxID=2213046 RepID=UPI00117E8F1B|nr:amidohydrolase [Robertkochia solimangrovi]TRZ45835.1 amidohydrolase [Robertkochia solimangrovi]